MTTPLLLKESHFQCKERQVWLTGYEIRKLEPVLSKADGDMATFYDISIRNTAIGSIFQCQDLTWTARRIDAPRDDSQSVNGFAHELYAAKYLEKTAFLTGLIPHA